MWMPKAGGGNFLFNLQLLVFHYKAFKYIHPTRGGVYNPLRSLD